MMFEWMWLRFSSRTLMREEENRCRCWMHPQFWEWREINCCVTGHGMQRMKQLTQMQKMWRDHIWKNVLL
eukprot:9927381-Ditylum_brightwellii.AAC.1